MGKRLSKIKIEKGDQSLIWKEKNIGSNEIADYFLQKDPDAIRVVNEASAMCGKLVYSILNLLNPDIIFFGGGFVNQIGDIFLTLILEEAQKCMNAVYSKGNNDIPIVIGALSNPIITGACKMAMDNTIGKQDITKESLLCILKNDLSNEDHKLLKQIYHEDLNIVFSRDPKSDLNKNKLRKLRNRGLIKTTEGLSFKDSQHIELTEIGNIIVKDILEKQTRK